MENSELITKSLSYIAKAYRNSEISTEDVAYHAGFSTDYFNRIFFMHTGYNVMEYVRCTRLKNAARLLRTGTKDILEIALDCGYESHESLSRAFKKQYDMTPSEYRKKYEKVQAYYGDFHNETVGARLLHEFKGYKLADPNDVIEYLLETDPLRYGYVAICFRVNGGVALYSGEDFRDGFVWFNEWEDMEHRFEGAIVGSNYEKIAEYFSVFSDERFELSLYSPKETEEVREKLLLFGVRFDGIRRSQQNAYTGEPYSLIAPDGYSMRELTYDDYSLIERFFDRKGMRLRFIQRDLYEKYVLGNTEHSAFLFGIFHGDRMVGLSTGGLQRTHGFVVNNCVSTSLYPEHQSEDVYRYAFSFVTNAALAEGALPIDDLQTPGVEEKNKCGAFDSAELGYKAVMYRYFLS